MSKGLFVAGLWRYPVALAERVEESARYTRAERQCKCIGRAGGCDGVTHRPEHDCTLRGRSTC
jgi:hypothetical protein